MDYDATLCKQIESQQIETAREGANSIMQLLIVLQWVFGVGVAIWISPLTYYGEATRIHPHIFAAIFLGGAFSILPLVLIHLQPQRAFTRYCIAATQMLMGALLIHLTGGRIETHFHVFGSLAFIAFYRDPKMLAVATVVVAFDHFFRGVYYPQSVFGVLTSSPWRWVEHACWVVFEDIFLLISIRQGQDQCFESARKQAQLEELVLQKRRFLSSMSHELRTPLNAIIGYSALLKESAEDLEERDIHIDAERIEGAGKHLLSLINNVMDLGQMEEGKMQIQYQEIDPLHLTQNVVESLRVLLNRSNNELVFIHDKTLPCVTTDPAKVRQVLINLVGNATKFCEDGTITLEIGVQEERLVYTCKDTGIGICPQSLDKIFEPFMQVATTGDHAIVSSGLGLYLSRQFAHALGGDLTVRSEKGKWSEFRFSLPLEPSTVSSPK